MTRIVRSDVVVVMRSMVRVLATVLLMVGGVRSVGAQTPGDTQPEMIGLKTLVPRIGADTVLEAKVKTVSAQLRCVVCQGLSVQDSPAELAQQMRGVVREQLAAGKSPDEVKAYFVEKYGEFVLLEPTTNGLNILVYALPVLLIVIGGGGIWYAVRRWTAPVQTDTGAFPVPDAEPSGEPIEVGPPSL
jgi:cytochrome c-type biogenesis protein CcmH